jgi:signal transduction histidine kinase
MARRLLASGIVLPDALRMSLRTRLILSYAALILVLGLAAWWGLQRLTADLTAALGETATSVGRSVFTVLRHERSDAAPGDTSQAPAAVVDADAAKTPAATVETLRRDVFVLRDVDGEVVADAPESKLRVVVDGRELGAEELAAHRARHGFPPEFEVRADLEHEQPTLMLRGDGFARTIPLPRSGVDRALARYTEQLGWGLLALLGAALGLSLWLAQRIARPLRALADAARSVAGGTLGAQAPDGGVPEVRSTIAAFNQMSARLQQLDAEAAALRADRELAELGEIGRGLAHSLRNPLHALGLSLEALAARPADPASAQALAQSGREQLQRVDQALRGFLALSAGDGAAATEVALHEVVDDVLLEASQRAHGHVSVRREGDDAWLRAVRAEVRVMLHALVINALEASPEQGAVVVRMVREGVDAARIEVSDEGEGVPDAIRARLFQPHVSGKPHGAGMGLYLAERLARLRYRGSIVLAPRAPRGTCATLALRAREVRHVG